MITVTVFYRMENYLVKGGSYIEAVTMRNMELMTWRWRLESLPLTVARNREHLTMEGCNMESMFG